MVPYATVESIGGTQAVADVARDTGGVKKVVKVFDYTD